MNEPTTLPEELVFPASRSKAFWGLVLALALLAFGLWLAGEQPIPGWLIAIFGGFLLLDAGQTWGLPQRVYLRLTRAGLEIHAPRQSRLVRWAEVERFEWRHLRNVRMIGIVYSEQYKPQRVLFGRLFAWLFDSQSTLPNCYLASADEIFATLTAWHARYRDTNYAAS